MVAQLYELTLIGRIDKSVTVNRWNYVGDPEPPVVDGAFGLIDQLGLNPTAGDFPAGKFGARLQALLSNYAAFDQVIVRNVYNDFDFVELPFAEPVIGTNSGSATLARTDSYGFHTNRTRLDVRQGTKRFAGVTKDSVDNLEQLNSGTLAACEAIASDMTQVLGVVIGSTEYQFKPVIVKKHKYVTPSGKTAYRYNTPLEGGRDAQFENLMTGIVWVPYTNTRSQDTRSS